MRIAHEMNGRLTCVSVRTPMGEVMRRYWIPACPCEQLAEPDGAPVRITLLGEDFVAFRDSAGDIGLVDAYCAHRRAPMFFARNDVCELKCVLRAWKYDTLGNCVDMPAEPPYSKFNLKVSIKAYPTYEAASIIWTYMGPQEQMPLLPDYEWMRAPDTHRRVSKTDEGCNYVQTMEGGIDTFPSFAHINDLADTRRLRSRNTFPTLDVEENNFGYRYASIRNVGPEESYVRVYAWTMPIQQMRAALQDQKGDPAKVPTIRGHLWVPINNSRIFVYNWIYSADESIPITDDWYENLEARSGCGKHHFIPGIYWVKADLSNDFFIDREVQRTKTFIGIEGVNTQDFAIQSGMGPIVDRSREALESSDFAIGSARMLLLEATEARRAGRAAARYGSR